MLLPQLRYCTKPFAAGSQIVRARLLRLLLECVKDVNRVSSRRQVERPVGPGDVNPDLTNARSDRLHGFPIVWFESLLDAPKLEARQSSTRAGNARMSRRELPSQMSGLSGIGHVNIIQVFV